MKRLKIGIIGVGSIAQIHIAAYKSNPQTELYAFCEINPQRLEDMGKQHGVTRLYTSEEEMLAALPELDAVSVCTWNSAHAACTITALRAGKHVLCEKPMATNSADAEEMLRVAKETGRLLMVGFVRRFGNDCDTIKTFIDKGDLGELYFSKAVYLRRHGNPGGWFGDKARSGGGPLIDLGVHVIDLTRYLAGSPKPISAYGVTFRKLYDRKGKIGAARYHSSSATDHDICDVEDMVSAIIRYDNGFALSLEASFSLNIKEDRGFVELFGDKAGARMSDHLEIYGEHNNYLTDMTFQASTDSEINKAFHKEIAHFSDCILNGTPCRNPAEDGVTLMHILDGVYESAKTGRVIEL